MYIFLLSFLLILTLLLPLALLLSFLTLLLVSFLTLLLFLLTHTFCVSSRSALAVHLFFVFDVALLL
jgi:hypothetical protein